MGVGCNDLATDGQIIVMIIT